MSDEVHYSNWAQQPDVLLACGPWTTPSWTPRAGLPSLVYEDDEGRLYTFSRVDLVTCPDCQRSLPGREIDG